MDDKNNVESAVALKYKPEEDIAPRVIAKGERKVAENIVKKAKENDIPVYKDEKLVKQLKNIELDENIPSELYEAVAQVLLFITKIDNQK
ncbi:EscU/YscU/HrcU family type III secretion system export apparatus switch protein [Criibacterium bergeronii]|uniref:Flagellar biogenesis protein n=1 Tax=Criibacterium bergeronii TaxID=1871336 RepID=A0A371IMJ6_9FIRM|nr:EscU/YscU/HrcU family type III secretion system export apparatus switch protein [Criibacterium bergeronii]MBS6062346.1 EscU/YscU/HrcU family type III secretion system export apparatus switch protein [Peptostreptococcaceae bacterium]RDY21694.1 flagellar biogenesis protein [Criibacterium bergeronii]TRW28602.1 flagellar biogenesis protein [Criibacterium bergeronii]